MSFASYLPQDEGYLPKWLLLVSIVSTINTFQAYTNPTYTEQLYNNTTVTPLSSRKFGTWTFVSSVIRLYAAYHISNQPVYDLALWTYGIALAHFVSEWLIFGSAKAKGRLMAPMVVASMSFAWMISQRGWYVK